MNENNLRLLKLPSTLSCDGEGQSWLCRETCNVDSELGVCGRSLLYSFNAFVWFGNVQSVRVGDMSNRSNCANSNLSGQTGQIPRNLRKMFVQIFTVQSGGTNRIKDVSRYLNPPSPPWLSDSRRSSVSQSPPSCSPPSSASTRCWHARVANLLPATAPQVINMISVEQSDILNQLKL